MKHKTNHKTAESALQVNEKASLEEQIAQRAHELWRNRGCEHGGELADWSQAQRKIHEWHHKQLQEKAD
jgi:hypothetical protein